MDLISIFALIILIISIGTLLVGVAAYATGDKPAEGRPFVAFCSYSQFVPALHSQS